MQIAKKLAADEGYRDPKQRDYAALLGVSQPQVSAWFKGDGAPSAESLLKLAARAQELDDRVWLLKQAGVNLDQARADLCGSLGDSLREKSRMPKSQPSVPISIIKDLRSAPVPSGFIGEEEGRLSLPAHLFPRPKDLICLRTVRREPWVPSGGDLVLIDQSLKNPREALYQRSAVFFEIFPTSDDSVRWRSLFIHRPRSLRKPAPTIDLKEAELLDKYAQKLDPEGYARHRAAQDEAWRHVREQAMRPGFLTGTIEVQHASDERNREWRPADDPWCLILRVDHSRRNSPEIMLSEWQTSVSPEEDTSIDLAGLLRDDLKIVGRVVGWLAVPAPARREKQEGP